MCTITLSYNENDIVASQKLAALLATGLFIQHDAPKELDIDYSDPSLYEEDDQMVLPEGKDSYTPEELRDLLIGDLNSTYGVKDAVVKRWMYILPLIMIYISVVKSLGSINFYEIFEGSKTCVNFSVVDVGILAYHMIR